MLCHHGQGGQKRRETDRRDRLHAQPQAASASQAKRVQGRVTRKKMWTSNLATEVGKVPGCSINPSAIVFARKPVWARVSGRSCPAVCGSRESVYVAGGSGAYVKMLK